MGEIGKQRQLNGAVQDLSLDMEQFLKDKMVFKNLIWASIIEWDQALFNLA